MASIRSAHLQLQRDEQQDWHDALCALEKIYDGIAYPLPRLLLVLLCVRRCFVVVFVVVVMALPPMRSSSAAIAAAHFHEAAPASRLRQGVR